MNEFVAKKLGEVLAFSRIGKECAERAGNAFDEALGEQAQTLVESMNSLADKVDGLANDITTAKAAKTTAKLRGMMEAYIGDEWDNPTEILEWLSFFLGAAAAHWALIQGAAQAIGDKDLAQTAELAVDLYSDYLETVKTNLQDSGRTRARS